MKQKNVVLMVVAAACGLAAAVLTTQMSGKPAAPDQVEILAAAKELPVGTKLDKQKLGELIKRKKVGKNDVPQEGVFFKEEDLADKFIQRPRGTDDVILVTDVGPKAPGLRPPAGKHLVTMKLPYDHVGPFIEPGSKVDVECAVQTQVMRRLRQFTLLTDVLVMAVDTMYAANGQQKGDGRPQINTVTVALTPEEARWFQIATRLGSDIRFIVRGEDSKKQRPPTEEELNRLFFEPDATSGPGGDGKPKGTQIKLWVPRSYLAAGTEITEDAIRDKFREKEFEELEAPKDGVSDLTEFLGKYLLRDAERGEPLGRDAFGEKPVEKDPVKPAPMKDDPPAKVVPKVETAPMPRKLERKPIHVWEPEITSPKGTERHRYEMYDQKEGWIYRGVVGKDGTITPGPAPEKAPTTPPPDGKIS